jgi:hypothetical protein
LPAPFNINQTGKALTGYSSFSSGKKFLDKYPEVILKPVDSTQGLGVIKVSSRIQYEVHIENKRKKFKDKGSTYHFLSKQIGSTPYLIQSRIDLAEINCRP